MGIVLYLSLFMLYNDKIMRLNVFLHSDDGEQLFMTVMPPLSKTFL